MLKLKKIFLILITVFILFSITACSVSGSGYVEEAGSLGCNGWDNKRNVITDENIKGYRDYDYKKLYPLGVTNYKAELVAFPVELSSSVEVNDYYYVKIIQANQFVGCLILLDVTYTADNYNKEINRLKKFTQKYKWNNETGVSRLLYDEDCKYFYYPAYIATYNALRVYEYVLLIGENRACYVYVRTIKDNETTINVSYLPKNYYEIKNSTEAREIKSFSIYQNSSMWKHDNESDWDI